MTQQKQTPTTKARGGPSKPPVGAPEEITAKTERIKWEIARRLSEWEAGDDGPRATQLAGDLADELLAYFMLHRKKFS